ncbi:MAG: TonB-dependent receptor, partial [Phenylobacterium sp.]|nr:TonB-dependent receptor [Phenylobacterium sp.]
MNWAFSNASRAALMAGLMSASSAAWAQQAQVTRPAGADTEVEAITVVGSLIATAPEDAAKPVEVFTVEELKEQGSPTVTEFVRSLTSAAPNTDNMAGATSGALVVAQGRQTLNLRGQGA